MRSVAVRPARRRGVVQDRHEHALGQRRAEREEERRLREQDVDRADAAVAEVLLGEDQRPAGGVGRDLVAGPGLPVGQRAEQGILLAAHAGKIGHQFLVELPATWCQRSVIARGGLEHVARLRPITPPIWPQAAAEVLDRIQVVVGQDHLPRHRLGAHLAQVETRRQHRVHCPGGLLQGVGRCASAACELFPGHCTVGGHHFVTVLAAAKYT